MNEIAAQLRQPRVSQAFTLLAVAACLLSISMRTSPTQFAPIAACLVVGMILIRIIPARATKYSSSVRLAAIAAPTITIGLVFLLAPVSNRAFSGLTIASFGIAFFVAGSEEVFFRGGLFNLFENHANSVVALFATSLLFSFAHLTLWGPRVFALNFFAAVLFGLQRIATGNVWASTFSHTVANVV